MRSLRARAGRALKRAVQIRGIKGTAIRGSKGKSVQWVFAFSRTERKRLFRKRSSETR